MKPRNVAALLVGALCVVLGLLLHFFASVTLPNLLALVVGGAFLLWQVLLLTVPWNLYFQARQVVRQVRTGRAEGIDVPEERAAEAARIARRLRLLAIGGHVLSAVVVAVITYVSGRDIGYYFSGFYLLSTLFRPAQAYFAHLRGQLTVMMKEARFPPDDVRELRSKLASAEAGLEELQRRVEQLDHRCDEQSLQLGRIEADSIRRADGIEARAGVRADQIEARANGRADQTEARFTARTDQLAERTRERTQAVAVHVETLSRRFEDAINGLTDNQDLVTGLRAFLRLLRSEQV